jgi:DNA-binding NarL/FixJ family response regulator
VHALSSPLKKPVNSEVQRLIAKSQQLRAQNRNLGTQFEQSLNRLLEIAAQSPESAPACSLNEQYGARLTAREKRVLTLIAEGKSTKEIAFLLNITFKTAVSHRSNLMAKLEIHDVAGLTRYAIRFGFTRA